MSETKDLLVEIGTEEIPPKALTKIASAFADGIEEGLLKAKLSQQGTQWFATPRRIAVTVLNLEIQQPDIENSRRGPSLSAAFDDNDKPTPAATGFANSCGVKVDDLETQKTDKGEWLSYNVKEKGKKAKDLIPDIANQALSRLPIPKRMRWSDNDIEFIRPVHWVVMLFGKEVVPCTILGITASNVTYGHRFHYPKEIKLKEPAEYQKKLKVTGKVIVDFNQRRELITNQINDAAKKCKGNAMLDDDLLDEVTALVEWPVAIAGNFDKKYLKLPGEVLIATMQDHQKYFPVVDKNEKLLNYFIAIANIESSNPDTIRKGNERVIRPRLSDAEFFWQRDTRKSLADYQDKLSHVVFQQKLGTLADKTNRISKLVSYIADKLKIDDVNAKRAANLCKCDLLTDMVGEFPELQGIMGKYYALHSKESQEVATAIEEQYMPKQAGTALPQSDSGQILAIADKMHTLAGLFGIGQQPTGDKDPFGLRRAALGVIRILIEKQLTLSISELVDYAFQVYDRTIGDAHTDLQFFMVDRAKHLLLEQGHASTAIEAVIQPFGTKSVLYTLPEIVEEGSKFITTDEGKILAEANKRITNILKKSGFEVPFGLKPENLNKKPNEDLLYENAEIELWKSLQKTGEESLSLKQEEKFAESLRVLSQLAKPTKLFFDEVMVNVNKEDLRNNRIILLQHARAYMNQVADLSLMAS